MGAGPANLVAFVAWHPDPRAMLWIPSGLLVEGSSGRGSRVIGERACPGQPPANRAPVNPAYRPPRNTGVPAPAPVPLGPVASETVPAVDLADSATIAEVITLLSSLGVSDALLQQVKSSIPPPSVNKPKSIGPEKQLQILAVKINALEQQLANLTKTRTRKPHKWKNCGSNIVNCVIMGSSLQHESLLYSRRRHSRVLGLEMLIRALKAPTLVFPFRWMSAPFWPGRCQVELVKGDVWKRTLGLFRLKRSLLGGGTILRISVEVSSMFIMKGWRNIRASMKQIYFCW